MSAIFLPVKVHRIPAALAWGFLEVQFHFRSVFRKSSSEITLARKPMQGCAQAAPIAGNDLPSINRVRPRRISSALWRRWIRDSAFIS